MFQVVARFTEPALSVSSDAARYDHRAGNDDFGQAGDLFRLMTPDQQARLCDNIAAAMTGVPDAIVRRQIGPFLSASASRSTIDHRPNSRPFTKSMGGPRCRAAAHL